MRKLRRFCKIIARCANLLKRLADKDMRISAYVHIVTGVTYLQHCHTGLLQKCHRGSRCGRNAIVLHVKHNNPRTNRAMEIVAIGMESTLDRTQPRRELTNRSPQNDVIAGTRSVRDPTPKTRRLRKILICHPPISTKNKRSLNYGTERPPFVFFGQWVGIYITKYFRGLLTGSLLGV